MSDPPTREVLLFNAALQVPATERAGYLSENCRDDAELQRRVAALLEAHEQAGECRRKDSNQLPRPAGHERPETIRKAPAMAITSSSNAAGAFPNFFANSWRNAAPPNVPTTAPITPANRPANI